MLTRTVETIYAWLAQNGPSVAVGLLVLFVAWAGSA
jgi:hypothetical protein